MKKTILLVEDDQLLRDMYELKFKKAKFTVHACETGRQALDWLSKNSADLAMVDILLPQMNGLQLIKTIRKDPQNNQMHIVILTNLTESDVNLHSTIRESLQVDAYFVKSQISPSELVAKISALLS